MGAERLQLEELMAHAALHRDSSRGAPDRDPHHAIPTESFMRIAPNWRLPRYVIVTTGVGGTGVGFCYGPFIPPSPTFGPAWIRYSPT